MRNPFKKPSLEDTIKAALGTLEGALANLFPPPEVDFYQTVVNPDFGFLDDDDFGCLDDEDDCGVVGCAYCGDTSVPLGPRTDDKE